MKLVLIIDSKLLAQEIISSFVDSLSLHLAAVKLWLRVDGPKLAVPAGNFVIKHEFGFAQKLLLKFGFLIVATSVRFAPGEAHGLDKQSI